MFSIEIDRISQDTVVVKRGNKALGIYVERRGFFWSGPVGAARLKLWIEERDEIFEERGHAMWCGESDFYGDVTNDGREKLGDMGYHYIEPWRKRNGIYN